MNEDDISSPIPVLSGPEAIRSPTGAALEMQQFTPSSRPKTALKKMKVLQLVLYASYLVSIVVALVYIGLTNG